MMTRLPEVEEHTYYEQLNIDLCEGGKYKVNQPTKVFNKCLSIASEDCMSKPHITMFSELLKSAKKELEEGKVDLSSNAEVGLFKRGYMGMAEGYKGMIRGCNKQMFVLCEQAFAIGLNMYIKTATRRAK